jgi:hypothetical protein
MPPHTSRLTAKVRVPSALVLLLPLIGCGGDVEGSGPGSSDTQGVCHLRWNCPQPATQAPGPAPANAPTPATVSLHLPQTSHS